MEYFWILVQIISPVSGFLSILALSKWRFQRRNVLVAVAYIVFITVLNFFIVRDLSYMLYGYPIMDFIYRIFNILLATVVVCLLIKQPPRQTIFTVLTAWVFVAVVDTCAITLRVMIGHAIELLWELMLYSFTVWVVFKLRVQFLLTMEHMQKHLWQLCLLPMSLTVCFFLQISIPIPLEQDPSNIPVALAICGVTIGVYGMLMFLFKTMHTNSEMEHNTKIMRIYVSALDNQHKLIEQNLKKITMFRHDLRHISKMMLASANSGDWDGVVTLIEHLDKNVNEDIGIFMAESVTGHKLLDTVLGFYISNAQKANIETTVDIRDIHSITADKTELAVTLANALENAINACQLQPTGEKRIIRVIGYPRGKQFFLGIDNTFSKEVRFDITTGLPLSNEKGHGIGSKSIAFFAKKYGAQLQYSTSDTWFQLRLLF